MRMLLTAHMDTETANRAVSDGTLPKVLEEVVEHLKPEAAYFTLQNGQRTCLMVFDMQDSAQMPPLLEPLFHANSSLSLQPAMNLEDLKAGLGGMKR
ncbi:hypothetical protein ABZY45_20925 [Streptomyces sp. NPDC006516]|uniref:hypothetical protein n=1 Tax=Streptomyces sp. NPDC006516 TaxID=3154309 RepID=UPI0033A6634D